MKLNRFLTDTEVKIFQELSNKKELISKEAFSRVERRYNKNVVNKWTLDTLERIIDFLIAENQKDQEYYFKNQLFIKSAILNHCYDNLQKIKNILSNSEKKEIYKNLDEVLLMENVEKYQEFRQDLGNFFGLIKTYWKIKGCK